MSQTKKADLILRNARLIDGTGASSQYGDLAILDDRLLEVGELGDLHNRFIKDRLATRHR